MSAYPNLHLLAYGAGGARLNRSELAVEAADALERLNRLTHATQNMPAEVVEAIVRGWRHWVDSYEPGDEPDDYDALKQYLADLTPAHDKEKS